MDGKVRSLRERWRERAEAAFERMFAGRGESELETLTQRENEALLISRELGAFLLEEHVAMDAAVQPKEASLACCPKCGQAGTRAVEKDKLPERTVATRAGEIRVQRQRWRCSKCRVIFFSAGR